MKIVRGVEPIKHVISTIGSDIVDIRKIIATSVSGVNYVT